MNTDSQKIIYFDGVCNLCHRAVRFIITRDKKAIFSFVSLQSNFAKKALKIHEFPTGRHRNETMDYNSVVYQKGDEIFFKSSAVLKILFDLGGAWKCFSVFCIIPKSWRDMFYDFVANHRYRWFGKMDRCMVPTEEIKSRFIE